MEEQSRLWQLKRETFGWIIAQCLLLAALGIILALSYDRFGIFGLVILIVSLLLSGYLFKFYIGRAHRQMKLLSETNAALDRANQGLIEILAAVIDARDMYVYGHSIQVTAYAVAIAEELGLSREEQEMIRKASLLHDIGKLGISEEILSKPGAVTEDELDILRQHPSIGAEILGQMEELKELAAIVASHHEFYNGQGYPHGKKGEEIPLGGRILCVADALDAMLSDRPYKAGVSLDQALEEIKRNAGVQFDPQVVETLLRVAGKVGKDFFKNSAEMVESALTGQAPSKRVLFRPKGISMFVDR